MNEGENMEYSKSDKEIVGEKIAELFAKQLTLIEKMKNASEEEKATIQVEITELRAEMDKLKAL